MAQQESKKKLFSPRARQSAKNNGLSLADYEYIIGTGFGGGISEKDLILAASGTRKIRISPLAKKLAQLNGVDTSDIKGSGVFGKILKDDILNAGTSAATAKPAAAAMDGEKEVLGTIPYKSVRKIIGDRLAESSVTNPHVFFTTDADMTKLMELRTNVNETLGVKCSVTDFLVIAVSKVLQKYPNVNSSLVEDTIYQYKSTNIGVAVAAESGLIVPVIKNVQDKNIRMVNEDSTALIDKARNGKLMPSEYTGGTFTISNLGMTGIKSFTAIINPPECAILAVSATRKEPVVVSENNEDKIVIRPMMNMTLSINHRVIDGYEAAQFMAELKRLLENPLELVLQF